MARTEPVDVPVIIDSVKLPRKNVTSPGGLRAESDLRSITRCNYLSVECDSPKPGWSVRIGGLDLPFLMLGLTGVIHRPFGDEQFDIPAKIESLFLSVEQMGGLLVNINDVWLPNFLFERSGATPSKGMVFRVHRDLFETAFLYREGCLAHGTFLERCHSLSRREAVIISKKETEAFSIWHKEQISNAVHQYPKNKSLVLPYHD